MGEEPQAENEKQNEQKPIVHSESEIRALAWQIAYEMEGRQRRKSKLPVKG